MPEPSTDVFGDGEPGDGDLSVDEALEALRLEDIDSMLDVDPGTLDADGGEYPDPAEPPAAGPEAYETPAESAPEDDDTYDFIGAPHVPDGMDADLMDADSISDDELDRIFAFNVEEFMDEDDE